MPPEACFYAHGTWELRQDVSQQAQRWRAQQPGAPACQPACVPASCLLVACLPACLPVCVAACLQQHEPSHSPPARDVAARQPCTCLILSTTSQSALPQPSFPLSLPCAARVMHELPADSTWDQVLHKTQPCIDFLQLGACPAGDACRCAHSAAELQPRPLPTPTLRDALAGAGFRLPPQHSTGNEQLPFPATQHPGAWEAAAEIAARAAASAARAASTAAATGLPGLEGYGLSPSDASAAASGAKRNPADVAASGASPKRQCTVGAAGAAALAADHTAAAGEPDAAGSAAVGEAGQQASTQQAQQGSGSPAAAAGASSTPPQPAVQPAYAYDRLRQQLRQAEKELSSRDKALADVQRQLQVRVGWGGVGCGRLTIARYSLHLQGSLTPCLLFPPFSPLPDLAVPPTTALHRQKRRRGRRCGCSWRGCVCSWRLWRRTCRPRTLLGWNCRSGERLA